MSFQVLPQTWYAAKRTEELEQKNEEYMRIMCRVKAEIEAFMFLLEITFESHPGVVEKAAAAAFNDFIQRGQRYKAALEEIIETPKDWSESYDKAYGGCVHIAAKELA